MRKGTREVGPRGVFEMACWLPLERSCGRQEPRGMETGAEGPVTRTRMHTHTVCGGFEKEEQFQDTGFQFEEKEVRPPPGAGRRFRRGR